VSSVVKLALSFSRAWGGTRVLLCTLVLCACTGIASPLTAQVNPRGATRTISTSHFRVHYPVRLDSIARRAAFLAEGAWSELAGELVAPAAPVELLLQDNVDLSNGFATTFPTNRITIYVVPPVSLAALRFHDDWLRLVITHELTHIFHLDRARGLWRVGRTIFGRNQAFFPNALMPSWVTEGIAVHYESKFTGSGRIIGTESRAVARAAARAGNVPGPGAWSAATTRYPEGQIPYDWGSMLMNREAERSDSAMRKFIDYTAYFPVPFLLNRAAKRGFGETFSTAFDAMRDSLYRADSTHRFADQRWLPLAGLDTLGNRSAAHPRYRENGAIEWVASNGREPAGLYRGLSPRSVVKVPGLDTTAPTRLARRNSLDVNVPIGLDGVLYSQYDYTSAYTIRSDLYRHDSTGNRRLTHGARLISPDVRRIDRAIVALQLVSGGTRVVRVSSEGSVTPMTTSVGAEWAEPRWSPRLTRIAAVQLLPSGVERIVLLDTLGTLTRVVAEARAVMASPSFSSDGSRLMWASDRSGRMQIEIADIDLQYGSADTTWRGAVRSMLNVSTGVYEPVFSPQGDEIAALVYRANGFVLSVAPYDEREAFSVADTKGYSAPVDDSYQRTDAIPSPAGAYVGASTPYHALRQLVPRYWQPVIGQARDGGSTYGAYTSGEDILGRHAYSASAQWNPRNGETDGELGYRYAGLGMPVVSASFTQNWDATYRITDTSGTSLGLVARRVDVASLALGWSVPHVRWAASYGLGASYELRHFASETDSLLGAPGSLLRTGTRYPALFVSGTVSTLARGAAGFSAEQGVSLSGSLSVRKREGASNTESWRGVGVLRAFEPLPLPGFARHVLALRVAGGLTDTRTPSEFSAGGVSGVLTDVIPGVSVGDPARTFPVRGFAPGAERGIRAVSGTFEYRAPLALVGRGAGLFPVFLDKLSVNAFADAARAWCPPTQQIAALCSSRATASGWLASVGGELTVDLALQYDVPYRLRLGVAKPISAPMALSRRVAAYATLGAFF
jgi:hypothetical protein